MPADLDVSQRAVWPLVVSRFAVRVIQRESLPTTDWIESRAELLKRFTHPSLERSGWPGLRWALLVDPELVDHARAALADVLATSRNVVPIIVRALGEPYARTGHPDDIAALDLRAARVASIRLDTDDALLPGVVERIVTAAERSLVGTLIDPYSGYQYDLSTGTLFTNARGGQGPFLALVNARDGNVIDAAEEHPRARVGRTIVHLHGRSWIQVVHGANLMNVRNSRPLRARVIAPWDHRHGGGWRRKLALASFGSRVSSTETSRILRDCGIEPESGRFSDGVGRGSVVR
jgi:Putative rhamnosyl transferase